MLKSILIEFKEISPVVCRLTDGFHIWLFDPGPVVKIDIVL